MQHTIQEAPNSRFVGALSQNKKRIDLLSGIGIAILCSHVPFAVSFALARINGLTAANYPAVEPTAAAAGLAICLLSMPIAMELKHRSLNVLAFSSAVMFWIFGLLCSFTM
jgi:hypothetical protein